MRGIMTIAVDAVRERCAGAIQAAAGLTTSAL
jgi:hypothetical protein